jgi:hypothetical protein
MKYLYSIRFTKLISKMDKKRFTISITAGIAVMLLLIGGTGATTVVLLNTAHAQTTPLGEPFFVEKGKEIGQRNWP